MSSYGLKDEVINRIKEAFASFPEVDEAVLYGSRAKGNYKPGSDIDLVLKGAKLNQSVVNKISLKIDDLLLPYIVELFLYRNINNTELVEHIDRVGVLFYKKP